MDAITCPFFPTDFCRLHAFQISCQFHISFFFEERNLALNSEMKLSQAITFYVLCAIATCMIIPDDIIAKIEARSSWTFLGCYIDNVDGRALPNNEAVAGGSSSMTNELCQTTCLAAGFTIAGTEYAGECC